jgi:hypothetical protein
LYLSLLTFPLIAQIHRKNNFCQWSRDWSLSLQGLLLLRFLKFEQLPLVISLSSRLEGSLFIIIARIPPRRRTPSVKLLHFGSRPGSFAQKSQARFDARVVGKAADLDFFAKPFPAVVFDQGGDHHFQGYSLRGIFVFSHPILIAAVRILVTRKRQRTSPRRGKQ